MNLFRVGRRSGPVATKNSVYGPSGNPSLTRSQRDAIYTIIMDRLNAAADLPMLAKTGKISAARQLGREMSDELQLVLDGLGWEPEGGSGDVELDLPLDQLKRTFARLRQLAAEELDAEPWEAEDTRPQAGLAIAACDQVLESVGDYEESAR